MDPTDGNEPGQENPQRSETSADMQKDENVVTKQPQGSSNSESSLEREGPSAEIEITPFSDEGCVNAAAGVGSANKDLCDGLSNLECVGPNVGCTMFINECPTVVTDCTFEICSANFLFGSAILCTLGLAFDTKFTWTTESVEAQLIGTGLDTSEGFALGALGCKVGLANKEKREKKWAKKKLKWEKKNKIATEAEGENGEVNAGADDAN